MNTNPVNKSRLYWQCRRGMLELDHLLQDFYQCSIDELSPAELQSFESLLQCPDAQLLEYLLGHSVPVDSAMAHVVHKIRQSSVH
jgi:antitoxin CptB